MRLPAIWRPWASTTSAGPTTSACREEASVEEVLAAYAPEIERLKAAGRLRHRRRHRRHRPDARTSRPCWPSSAWSTGTMRMRCATSSGDGACFTFIPEDNGPVIAIECEPGDLIRVPRGTWHWFDLCGDRNIRAIRLFQDKAGWTPHYTDSGADKGYQPLCLGPSYIPAPDGVELKPHRRRPAGHRGHDHAARFRPPNIVWLCPRSSCGFPRAPLERSRGSRRRRPAQRRAR